MNDITTRFLQFVAYLVKEGRVKGNKEFAEKVGISNSSITELKKGRANVGMALVSRTVQEYPEISTDWLLRGEGDKIDRSRIAQVDYSIKGQKLSVAGDVKAGYVVVEKDVTIPVVSADSASLQGVIAGRYFPGIITLPTSIISAEGTYACVRLPQGECLVCRLVGKTSTSKYRRLVSAGGIVTLQLSGNPVPAAESVWDVVLTIAPDGAREDEKLQQMHNVLEEMKQMASLLKDKQ